MYRIKLPNGDVLQFDSQEALTRDIHSGVVGEDSLIFHQRAEQWLPIHVHPAYKNALATEPTPAPAAPAARPIPAPRVQPAARSSAVPQAAANGQAPALRLVPKTAPTRSVDLDRLDQDLELLEPEALAPAPPKPAPRPAPAPAPVAKRPPAPPPAPKPAPRAAAPKLTAGPRGDLVFLSLDTDAEADPVAEEPAPAPAFEDTSISTDLATEIVPDEALARFNPAPSAPVAPPPISETSNPQPFGQRTLDAAAMAMASLPEPTHSPFAPPAAPAPAPQAMAPAPAPAPYVAPAPVAAPAPLPLATGEHAVVAPHTEELPVPVAAAKKKQPMIFVAAGAAAALIVIAVLAFRKPSTGSSVTATAPAPTGAGSAPLVSPPASVQPAGLSDVATGTTPPAAEPPKDAAPTDTKESAKAKTEKTDKAGEKPVVGEPVIVAAPSMAGLGSAATAGLKTDVAASLLAAHYGTAHDAAWNDLATRLRLAGFDQLFSAGHLAPNGASGTRASIVAARNAIAGYRTRVAAIDRSYGDSATALISGGNWDAGERREWDARPKRSETDAAAAQANGLMASLERMYSVLATNSRAYEVTAGGLAISDGGAQRDYWEVRRTLLSQLNAAGDPSARVPTQLIVRAIGSGRPPEGINAAP